MMIRAKLNSNTFFKMVLLVKMYFFSEFSKEVAGL